MSGNRYYDQADTLINGTIADADDVESKFKRVTTGFDLVESEIDQTIRITNVDLSAPLELSSNAASRADTMIGFSSDGQSIQLYPSIPDISTALAQASADAATASAAADAATAAASTTGLVWTLVSSNTSAQLQYGYMVDTSSGAVTITLPASPFVGARVGFMDAAGTWSVNSLTVARNGKLIMGLDEDLIANTQNLGFDLIFTGDTNGWRLK